MMSQSVSSETRRPLPVFPFSEAQVADVAEAIRAELDFGYRNHFCAEWEGEDGGCKICRQIARSALTALARVLRLESEPDPMGFPKGYGYRTIRGCTAGFIVHPDETWEPAESSLSGALRGPDEPPSRGRSDG